jgi:RNA:NAD 2'-phosphotransferase (TPT1/KptA family)
MYKTKCLIITCWYIGCFEIIITYNKYIRLYFNGTIGIFGFVSWNISFKMNTPRLLIRLLRLTASSRGCDMDDQGFVPLVQLIRLPEFQHLTFELLEKIVREDRKGRFELKRQGRSYAVMAVQGHSFGLMMMSAKNVISDIWLFRRRV